MAGLQAAIAAVGTSVTITVDRITRSGVDGLEAALNAWAHEYLQEALNQQQPGSELISGTLGVDTSSYSTEGLLIWTDTCRPAAADTAAAAGNLDLGAHLAGVEHEAPQYDRVCNDALADPAGRGWAFTPIGASTKRGVKRSAAEAADTDAAATTPAAVAAGAGTPCTDGAAPAGKRRFLGYHRCFNCGSYAHGVAGCPEPVDKARIAAAQREDQEGRQAAQRDRASRFAQGRQRYFDQLAAGSQDPYAGCRPGAISAELAEALGMPSAQHPPPWLDRLVRLGLPPAYMVAAASGAGAGAGAGTTNPTTSTFVVREGDTPEPEEGAAAAPEGGQDAAQQPSEGQQEGAAVQQAGPEAASAEGGVVAAAGPLDGAGSIEGLDLTGLLGHIRAVVEGSPAAANDTPTGGAAAGHPCAAAAGSSPAGGGTGAAADGCQVEQVCSVVFPGLNGPLPQEPGLLQEWERALAAARG